MVPVLRSRRGHDVDGEVGAPIVEDIGGANVAVERDSTSVSLSVAPSGFALSSLSAVPEQEVSDSFPSRRASCSASPRNDGLAPRSAQLTT